jgi:hypothetical protein
MFWNWNEYTSNQEMLYDETAYFGDGSVHILPYDPKWHELFAILYFLSKIMQVPGRSI